MHGGTNPGAPKGNRNAFKHGRWAADEIEFRQEVREMILESRRLIEKV